MFSRIGGLSSTFVSNPRRKRKRNPGFGFTRNGAGPVIAGIPIVEAGLGAAAAIAVGAAVENIGFIQDQINKLPAAARPAAGPALTGLAGWAAFQYGKGMIKDVGKWTLIASLFRLVDNVASAQIKSAVQNLFPAASATGESHGTRGLYLDVQRSAAGRATAGMYLNTATGGAMVPLPGIVAGQRSMFGVR